MFDEADLPPPDGYVSPLRNREPVASVDAGVSVPVGAVDFEQDADVGEPEVEHADDLPVFVEKAVLPDVADADAVEDASDSVFQLGNNGHESSVAAELPVAQILEGDCIEVMRTLPSNSIDAIVTDPPYGLEFMSAAWDSFREAEDDPNPSGPQSEEWGGGAGNPFARNATPRYAGKAQGSDPSNKFLASMRAYQQWTEHWAAEAYRVLKPGGHLLTFGGTRTHHRQTVAIENAGFEIRDELQWIYLSGFPKSRDVSKDVDRLLGAEREVIGTKTVRDIRRQPGRPVGWGLNAANRDKDEYIEHPLTAPTTDEAKQWSGYGTALKPACEPILMARKPMPAGSVARNLLEYGTGALNIDATRIPVAKGDEYVVNTFDEGAKPFGGGAGEAYTSRTESKGRWPSNVILTDPVFDGGVEGVVGGGERSSGVMKAGTGRTQQSIDYGIMPDVATLVDTYGDSGGVSRMFIIPKAARSEKEPLFNPEDLDDTNTTGPMAGRGQPGMKCRKCHRWKVSGNPCTCAEPDFEQQAFVRPKVKNDHPTVKPLDLICHLVRLVCPPGAVVLDPFLGSGTTAKAADLEGRQWIGIERDPHFAKIARARLSGTQQGLGLE